MYSNVKKLTFSAVLVALGLLIPIVMPVKVVIGPASFTLASHVPVFLAMFISPGVAVSVALGTAFGFFLSFPVIIAARALSHVFFAVIGAIVLQKKPSITSLPMKFSVYNLFIAIIHSVVELFVVSIFFFTGNMSGAVYDQGFLYVVCGLIGIGGVIHSLVDYGLAYYLALKLNKQLALPAFIEKESENKIITSK